MRIQISALRRLAKKHSLSHLILFAYHPDSEENHIVTYGKSLDDCSQAADFGNKLKGLLGWPESLHIQPSRVKRLQKRNKELQKRLHSLELAARKIEKAVEILKPYLSTETDAKDYASMNEGRASHYDVGSIALRNANVILTAALEDMEPES